MQIKEKSRIIVRNLLSQLQLVPLAFEVVGRHIGEVRHHEVSEIPGHQAFHQQHRVQPWLQIHHQLLVPGGLLALMKGPTV